MTTALRPIERRVLAMREAGMSDEEIGRRLKRSPEHVARIAAWATLPARQGQESDGATRSRDGVLSPRQRRVMAMRSEGLSHAEIGRRFRRSERYIRQVEGLAHFRRYQDLLG
jgi:DNA-binding CsgD family transcriptional regulator